MPVNYAVAALGATLRTKLAVMPGWFPDLSHTEFIDQVAAYGFPAFESLGAGDWDDRCAVRARCERHGIAVGAISSSGTIRGEGPVNPGFHAQFEQEIGAAIVKARELGSCTLLALAGASLPGVAQEAHLDALVAAGKRVAPRLEDAAMTLVWEPLNTKVNHAGYALVTSADAAQVVRRTGSPAVKFLFDIYHQQISEGDVIRNLQTYSREIGHYHFADNPGRHEPGTGELCFRSIFKAIHDTGYQGIVAAEFSKTCPTESLLRTLVECDSWARP